MQHRWRGFVTGMLAAGLAILAGCRGAEQIQGTNVIVINNLGGGTFLGGTAFGLNSDPNCHNMSMTLGGGNITGVTWVSRNTSLVTVSADGVAAAVQGASGFTYVVAQANGFKSDSIKIIVTFGCGNNNPGGASSITLSPPGGSFPVGTTVSVTASCSASGTQATCSGVSLSSSNPLIVQVIDASHVNCRAQGSAVVTVSGTVNGTPVTNQYTFTCTQNTPTGTFSITPQNPTLSLQNINGICTGSVQFFGNFNGQQVTPTWSGTGINSSGLFTATSAGTFTITATYNGQTAQSTVTVLQSGCTTGNGTLTATPNPLTFTLCQAGFTGTTPPRRITLFTDNGSGPVAVDPSQVVYEQAGQLLSIDPVSGMATPANLGSSYVRLSTKSNPTNYVQVPINVTNTACTQTSLVVNPSSINISNCSGFLANYAPVVTISGSSTSVPVTWSGIGNLGTVNGGSFTLNGTVGTVTLTGTSQTGGTVQLPVTVTACQTGPMTVTVSPSTFNDIVGQQRVFTAQVTNAPSGSTPTISWTVSPSTCAGQSTGNGTTFTVSWIATCSNVTVTATASAGGTQATGTATGAVTNGNVVCTISYNGTTSGSITITQGQTIQVTASCTNGSTTFKPYWSSSDPLVVTVQGATFVENINGVNWYSGPTAMINGRAKGSATITVQVDVRNPTPIASRTVVVQ